MIPFISRHIPTDAQRATVAERFGSMVCLDSITFRPGSVVIQFLALWNNWTALQSAVEELDDNGNVVSSTHDTPRVVAGVFPVWAALELLRADWTVVEFVNDPSARNRGQFVCRGAFVHYRKGLTSEFLPCPIPVQEQDDGPLLGALRTELTLSINVEIPGD